MSAIYTMIVTLWTLRAQACKPPAHADKTHGRANADVHGGSTSHAFTVRHHTPHTAHHLLLPPPTTPTTAEQSVGFQAAAEPYDVDEAVPMDIDPPPFISRAAELDELLNQLEAQRQEDAMRKPTGSFLEVTASAYILISESLDLTDAASYT